MNPFKYTKITTPFLTYYDYSFCLQNIENSFLLFLLVLQCQLFRALFRTGKSEISQLHARQLATVYYAPILRMRDAIVLNPDHIRMPYDILVKRHVFHIHKTNGRQHWPDCFQKAVVPSEYNGALPRFIGKYNNLFSFFFTGRSHLPVK